LVAPCSRGPRDAIETVLAAELSVYRSAIESRSYDLAELVQAVGVLCSRCRSSACARDHARRFRKRVTDLSTGAVFLDLPILRVIFCDDSTASLMPAELWKGRATVSSVLETTVRVHRDGLQQAQDWTSYAGDGEEMVSERTLRRWRDLIAKRLVGSAFAWLGPELGLAWSDTQSTAVQLDRLHEALSGSVLLAFRAATGHAVLDRPREPRDTPRTHSRPRPVPGRLAPAPPHDPPSKILPRGAWSRSPGRGPPPRRASTPDHGGSTS
jgi:hypothetical protein